MTIGTIGNRHNATYIDPGSTTDVLTTQLGKNNAVSGFTGVEDSSSDDSDGGSAASISSVGTLVSSLAALQRQDSDSFKSTTGDLAESLRAAAEDVVDSSAQYQLGQLASAFSNASQTGSLSSLVSNRNSSSSLRGYAKSASGLGFGTLFSGLGQGVLQDMTSFVQARLAQGIDPIDAA